jgi:NADP-dependent 3-hydroxy acid dehydrogenase YdfG
MLDKTHSKIYKFNSVLIAGGTDGIGLAITKILLKSNYCDKIYVLGRNFSKVKQEKIVELKCDITDNDSITRALNDIDQPLDIFINTIGTFNKAMVSDIKSEDIYSHFILNSISNINLTTQVLKKLNPDFSQILTVLATLALEVRESYALQSATKSALKTFLETLRLERSQSIRVMNVFPPSLKTEIFSKSGDRRDVSKYPSPDIVAEIVLNMLCQPASIEITDIIIKNRL